MIIVVILSVCNLNLFEHFYYDTKYNAPCYAEGYITPKFLVDDDNRPKSQFLVNGIGYKNIHECIRECQKYSPPGLKNQNYCINNYGEAICYPSTW